MSIPGRSGETRRYDQPGKGIADIINPANFPDDSLSAAENYCRNPTDLFAAPWCFVNSTDEYNGDICDVPHCIGKLSYYQLRSREILDLAAYVCPLGGV